MTTLEVDDRLTRLSKALPLMCPEDAMLHLGVLWDAAYQRGWDDARRTPEAYKAQQRQKPPGLKASRGRE